MQQLSIRVVGFLSGESYRLDGVRLAPLRQGLNENGYIEGRNFTIEYRGAEGRPERLAALAADLVRHPVSVIVAAGPTAALAAKASTTTIPVVFTIAGDPVELGLVASVNRPGGNVTGVSSLASLVVSKQLELLSEIVPAAAPIGFLVKAGPQGESETSRMRAAAHALGRELLVATVSTESDIEAAFAFLVERRTQAIAVGNDAVFNSRPKQLAALASRHAVRRCWA